MANIMAQKSKYLTAKWNKKLSLVEKVQKTPLTFEKKAALANVLENLDGRIRAMEATNPGNIGQYKRYAMDIVTAIVPNLIAFDVMAVQAMDNRVGMINYIDYNYSKAKGSTPANKVFASSINMGQSDPYYSSDLVSNEIIATGDGSKTQFEVTLPWNPVKLETFTLESTDSSIIGITDAADRTQVTGTGITSGTITPDGKLVLELTAPLADKADLIVNYRYDNESVRSDGFNVGSQNYVNTDATGQYGFTNVPEVELRINSLPVTAQARTMRSFWSFDAQYELQKELTA